MRLTEARQGVRMLKFVERVRSLGGSEVEPGRGGGVIGLGGADVPTLVAALRGRR